MTTAWQAEALGWLGIDVWEQRLSAGSAEERTDALSEKAEIAAEPQARMAADRPVERRSVSGMPRVSSLPDSESPRAVSEALSVEPVAPPVAASTETAATTLCIEAPVDGAFRQLAERIAKVAKLPAASIGIVESERAAVTLGDQRWPLVELVEQPSRKRDLWRQLCRR